jgi:prolyl 4-hydroxylase
MESSPDINEIAARLIAAGRQQDALAMARQAAADGLPDALHLLALWHIIGNVVPRNLPTARSLLRDAAAKGHILAARTEIAMAANGSGGVVDFAFAIGRLSELAASDRQSAGEINLLQRMDLSSDGSPRTLPRATSLDVGGHVLHFADFLSHDECDHIVLTTRDHLQPALVFDPRTGRQVRDPVRTAAAMVVSPIGEDLVMRSIALRIAAASNTDVEQGEATTVMRYRPGEEFKLHHDTLDRTENQRSITMLIYLNDGFTGGNTLFPNLDLSVKPRKGDAILFHNVLQGRVNKQVRHAGLPVSSGEKWLLSKWIREHSFSLWDGPERYRRQA